MVQVFTISDWIDFGGPKSLTTLGLTWQHVDLTSLWSWYRVVDTVAFQWKWFLVHFEKFIIYIHEDHAITYIYGRRCNSAERGFRDTTCTCKKPFILLKLKIMLRSFLGVLIMLHFKFGGLILQKMFTVPKICIHFLRIFFCNAQNQNISYNKKNHHL